MRTGGRIGLLRVISPVLAVCAAALVLFVTLTPVQASDKHVVMPAPRPANLDQMRADVLTAGQPRLTDALLANYVKRQQQLRAIDVTPAGLQPELTSDVLMGYLASGSVDGGNTALSAIASFTSPAPRHEPTVNADLLASYVANDYKPTAARIEHANSERECLAQAIYHEARGESAFGQRAVANVIVNRARSARYPSTLCGVIYQNADQGLYRCQFTFACDGRDDTPGERRAWKTSMALASEVFAEFATGEDIGAVPASALFYHTTNVRPEWSNTFQRVGEVDSHIFYAPN